MGQNTFLKLEGIKGSVTDANYDDCIEISSFSFNVSNMEDALLKTDERLEGATVSAISVSKKLDRSSASLLKAACENTDLGTSYVYFCRPKGALGTSSGLETYITFTMENTSIENFDFSGSGYPAETLTLQFTSLDWDIKDETGASIGSGKYTRPESKLSS